MELVRSKIWHPKHGNGHNNPSPDQWKHSKHSKWSPKVNQKTLQVNLKRCQMDMKQIPFSYRCEPTGTQLGPNGDPTGIQWGSTQDLESLNHINTLVYSSVITCFNDKTRGNSHTLERQQGSVNYWGRLSNQIKQRQIFASARWSKWNVLTAILIILFRHRLMLTNQYSFHT